MPQILGKQVGEIGYGLMGLTWGTDLPDEEQAFAAMRTALAAGSNFWNGGEFYGTTDHNSLTLLKKYYDRYPEDADKVVLNIKGAFKRGPFQNLRPDGRPESVKQSVNRCLEMLGGRGKIDMFECARVDVSVPLEQTLGALAELVDEGKIGGVALSEVDAETIRRAAKITKIVAVEIELSLWRPDTLTNGIVQACAELDIPIIAYSPIGRGVLAGGHLPRFQPAPFEIMEFIQEVEKLASRKNCTAAQLAINWVRSLSKRPGMPQIYPIPGTTVKERVIENSKIIELTEEEMKEIDSMLATFST